jgi:hypothetical protein
VVIVVLLVTVVALGVENFRLQADARPPKFDTTYQAVLLDSGQVYYGKITDLRGSYAKMTGVYYVVHSVDQQTKEAKNILVRRGKEWHAPTETYFNSRHIVMIEPVSSTSDVAKLISQAEAPR